MEWSLDFFRFDVPLALGWPVAIWLIVQNAKMARHTLDVVDRNTEAMTRLADRLAYLVKEVNGTSR